MNIYNVLSEQFNDTLQREGVQVYEYWTNKEINCFFRINKDTNQVGINRITIYCPVDSNIFEGSIIQYNSKLFLVIDQETVENNVYRKCDLVECTSTVEIYSNSLEFKFPVYMYDLQDTNLLKSANINVINGDVELITQYNDITKNVSINSEFSCGGGRFKVVNLFYKNGILHILGEITLNKTITYTLTLTASKSCYSIGEVASITALAKRSDDGVINNPTLQWSSSDMSKATVSGNVITCIAAGTVVISCLWVEKNITQNISITISEASTKLTCTITGGDEIRAGSSKIYTAAFYDHNGNTDSSIIAVWSLTLPTELQGGVTISTQNGNSVTLKVGNKDEYLGADFTLNLSGSGTDKYSTSKKISVFS